MPTTLTTTALPESRRAGAALPRFLTDVPRYLFLTGKGGVGKTSLACAGAMTLAGQGKRVLLVSTDPASNVGQVFDVTIGNTITPIPAVEHLSALEIDPDQAAAAYRETILGPVRGLLPDADLALVEEQLSGACTTEIAAFNEFTGLITASEITDRFDHIVFDTAPTGHTIRLLQLPGSWNEFLDAGKGDASCLGPMAGLERQRTVYADAVRALGDPQRTRLVLVTRAQRAAVTEIARTHTELAAVGLAQQYIVVNAVLPQPEDDDDPLAAAIFGREQAVLLDLPESLRRLPRDVVALKGHNMVGLSALATLFSATDGTDSALPATHVVTHQHPEGEAVSPSPLGTDTLASLVQDLVAREHGLVLVMGKGGVGKTTIASALAVALAQRGLPVHLSTTDPAAHLDVGLHDDLPNLEVSRIDPDAETRRYREQVLRTKGAALDEAGRAGLEEDLRSPCTEEIAVFQAFSKVVNQASRRFVVLDTAPTGHTLLLLDATGSYHRDIVRQLGETSASFRTPMMRLQDPAHTAVILATLAEETPVLEASQLQSDLRRAGISPWAWVVNQSLAATDTTSPLLHQRAANERVHIAAIRREHASRCAVLPMLTREPVGAGDLLELATSCSLSSVSLNAH